MTSYTLLERDIEEILYKHHNHFIELGLIPSAKQLPVTGGRVDLIFTDRFGDKLLVEIKRGPVTRDAIAQLMDYQGSTSQYNMRQRLMIIAESIAGNWKNTLDRQAIEYREYIERDYLEFLDRNDKELLDKIQERAKNRIQHEKVLESPVFQNNTPMVKLSPTADAQGTVYWLIPFTEHSSLKGFIIDGKCWGYGDRTPGRKSIKPGDWVCFYLSKHGVVAHAIVTSFPSYIEHKMVNNPEKYSWVFQLSDIKVYDNVPVRVDASLRAKLEAFHGKLESSGWGWFVQNNRPVSKNDFLLLTRNSELV